MMVSFKSSFEGCLLDPNSEIFSYVFVGLVSAYDLLDENMIHVEDL